MVAEILPLVPEHFRGHDRGWLARYIEKGVECACRGYDPGAWSRLKHQPKFHIQLREAPRAIRFLLGRAAEDQLNKVSTPYPPKSPNRYLEIRGPASH